MIDTKSIALLLGEGEAAKAKSLRDFLDGRSGGDSTSRVVLNRLAFAHLAASERYLAIAKGPQWCDGCGPDNCPGGSDGQCQFMVERSRA